MYEVKMNKTIFFLSVLGLVIYTTCESTTCLTVHKEESGAPAVFQSPKHDPMIRPTTRCQSATRQGRRRYQEDSTFCTLDLRIPFPDTNGIRDTSVAIVAVFDGHNGAEASEMASSMLLEYFTLHTLSSLDTAYSFLSNVSKGMLLNKVEHEYAAHLSKIFSGDFWLEILKEALLNAIHDIDVAFCKEASRYNFNSGSTAAVVLIVDSHILAANVGDSKAFLCTQTPLEAKATLLRLYEKRRREGGSIRMKEYIKFRLPGLQLPYFAAKELTMDHHPNRADERSRVEAAGGYVAEWAGVSRVNGHLAVSRSIGDLPFKRFGVVSAPEVTDWQPLTANDSYLVVVSDGVLEKLRPQDVCDLFWELRSPAVLELRYGPSCSYSLADCVVDTALERGSMDNVAAVVVPFGIEDLPSERSRVQNNVGGQFGNFTVSTTYY